MMIDCVEERMVEEGWVILSCSARISNLDQNAK